MHCEPLLLAPLYPEKFAKENGCQVTNTYQVFCQTFHRRLLMEELDTFTQSPDPDVAVAGVNSKNPTFHDLFTSQEVLFLCLRIWFLIQCDGLIKKTDSDTLATVA
jgi:hypothetical protein